MTKVALIPSENYQAVMDQFGVLHPSIMDKVSETYRGRVFVEGKQVVLTSGYRDTVNSCNSSNYASELLHLYNPQDGEPAEIEPPVPKRFRPAIITYSMAVQQLAPATMVPSQTNTNTCTSISSITEAELDSLYERLKHKISSESGDTLGWAQKTWNVWLHNPMQKYPKYVAKCRNRSKVWLPKLTNFTWT